MKKLIFLISLSLLILVGCERKRSQHNSEHEYERIIWVNSDVNIEHKHEHTIWANPDENIEHVYERSIWINPDVECCGVKDPLNNLGWLKETSKFDEYNEAPQTDYNYIFLYRNKLTYKDYIVVNYYYSRISWVIIYDCKGNLIDGGGYSLLKREQIVNREYSNECPEPCDTCDEFFQSHVLIDTIAYSDVKL